MQINIIATPDFNRLLSRADGFRFVGRIAPSKINTGYEVNLGYGPADTSVVNYLYPGEYTRNYNEALMAYERYVRDFVGEVPFKYVTISCT
jgi:hypothetical protein